MRAIVVCGGDFAPELLPAPAAGDLLIAADSGLAHLLALGRAPDVTIGDYDSLGYTPRGGEVVTLPVQKDDTDLIAALRLGLGRGARDCLLLGALGGARVSHSLAAIQALEFLAAQGARGEIRDARCRITRLGPGEQAAFPPAQRGYLSVLALTDEARVTIEGLAYELQQAALTRAFPLGQSNHFTGRAARVHCASGALLLIEEPG